VNTRFWSVLTAAWLAGGGLALAEEASSEHVLTGIYAFTVRDIDGNDVGMASFQGRVLLIVNVASKCGFTSQYEGLERLYRRYGARGLMILGFPANNFMNQEPGTNEQIRQFCTTHYGVTFPVFAKISVKGSDKHPLYAYLTAKETNPEFSGEITWNFNKFLVGRDGAVLDRFGSSTKPESQEVLQAIEEALSR